MDPSYRNKLLREAAEFPDRILNLERFWKLELWPHYLRRCDDILFEDPRQGLAFSKPAPGLAEKIAERHSETSRPDLLLLGHAYLGTAYRRNDDYAQAEASFNEASQYEHKASLTARAEYLRRLAYLRLFQMDPECFPIIEEAIAIHKRGNLVNRHPLGECLICRGRAFVMFGQYGKSFDDYSAALNHVSIKVDPKPYYCAVHSLAFWAADFGTQEQLETARENLTAALGMLKWGKSYARLKLRWLIAVIDTRLGTDARAELAYREVREELAQMGLGYEVGMISIDLAMLYLVQDQQDRMTEVLEETAALFQSLGVEEKAQDTMEILQRAESVDRKLLKNVRERFSKEIVHPSRPGLRDGARQSA